MLLVVLGVIIRSIFRYRSTFFGSMIYVFFIENYCFKVVVFIGLFYSRGDLEWYREIIYGCSENLGVSSVLGVS